MLGVSRQDPSGSSKGLSARALRLLPSHQPHAALSEPLHTPVVRAAWTYEQQPLQTPGRPSSDPGGDNGGNRLDVTARPAGLSRCSCEGAGVRWGSDQPSVPAGAELEVTRDTPDAQPSWARGRSVSENPCGPEERALAAAGPGQTWAPVCFPLIAAAPPVFILIERVIDCSRFLLCFVYRVLNIGFEYNCHRSQYLF